MINFRLLAITVLLSAPAWVFATGIKSAYDAFKLSDSQASETMRAINATCPSKAEDVASTLSVEARQQAACRSRQVVKKEAFLKTTAERKIASLPKSSSDAARADQKVWTQTRYNECKSNQNDNLGGALKNVVFANCQLLELKRRTLWMERKS